MVLAELSEVAEVDRSLADSVHLGIQTTNVGDRIRVGEDLNYETRARTGMIGIDA